MKKQPTNIQAHLSPLDFRAMQLTYETEGSRRVISLPPMPINDSESEPHGAGSYHDPQHHHLLMDRVEAMLQK